MIYTIFCPVINVVFMSRGRRKSQIYWLYPTRVLASPGCFPCSLKHTADYKRRINFSWGVPMTSTRKFLLSSAAATMAVTAGNTGALAADALLKKAPPIQYVKICDQYGAGFFVIPGTQTCLQLRGSLQIDMAFQQNKDLVFMTRSGGSGHYSVNKIPGNQMDNWGYEVNTKPKFDARNETSWGTMRAYVELKAAIDAGTFNGPGGFGGNAETMINGG